MTTETNHSCPTCGAALAQPASGPPEPARKAYMIEYYAPAGVAYEPIVTDDPVAFLARAKECAAAKTFTFEDFEPTDDAVNIHEIKIVTEEGDPAVPWVDPDFFPQRHADEILDYLQTIIDAADGLTEKRRELDETISEITSCAEDAAHRLDALRLQEGGVQ
jgi:hypothetical protein